METLDEVLQALVLAHELPKRFLSTYQESRTIVIDKTQSASLAAEHFLDTRLSQFARYETLPSLMESLQRRIQLPRSLRPQTFAGRKEFLEKFFTLSFPVNWNRDYPTPFLLVHGPGGMGKTELALAFGNLHPQKFSLVKFISCENPHTYENHYKELAQMLKIATEKCSLQYIISEVHRRLESVKIGEGGASKPWLLIFDNVEKEIPYPANGGVVLCTAQREDLFEDLDPHVFCLPPLENEEALTLFTGYPLEEVFKLNKELHGYPVLLRLAKRHLEKFHLNIKEYLEALGQSQEVHPIFQAEGRYKKSIEAAFMLTLKHIQESYPEAFELLQMIAYLNPEHLPVSLIQKTLPKSFRLELSHLEKAGLLQYDQKAKTYSCDRLLQMVIQKRGSKDKEQEYARKALRLLTHNIEINLISETFQEGLSEALVHHIATHLCQIKAPLDIHLQCYQILTAKEEEPHRHIYIKVVEENLGDTPILQTLLQIPNRAGVRLAFDYNFNHWTRRNSHRSPFQTFRK